MQFVARVEARARELRDACKQTVSDEMLSGVVVEGLLPAYNSVVEALRVSKALTMVNLKDELVTADNRLDKQRTQDAELRAAAAAVQHQRQSQPANDRQRYEDRECFYCGKKGHVKSERRKLKRDEKSGQTSNVVPTPPASQVRSLMMLMNALCNIQRGNRIVPDDVLLFDTGATHHMVSNRQFFAAMKEPSMCSVICGGGEEHPVLGQGTVYLKTPYGLLTMSDVLFVPSLATNVMSGLTALDRGFSWAGRDDTVQLMKNGRICFVAKRHHVLLAVDGSLTVTEGQCYSSASSDAALWHRRLAHPGDGALTRTLGNWRGKTIPSLAGNISLVNSFQTAIPGPRRRWSSYMRT
jgi:hypothetical protein